jgi:hypothetical protein
VRRQQLQRGPLHGHELALLEPAAHARQRRGVDHAQARLHHGRGACGRRGLDHIAPGLAGDQAAGVGVLRVAKHLGHSALLHQHALLHHGHAVGKAAHQVQVVRDEQHGHAGLLRCRSESKSRIWPRSVTSSAVVGSSASSSAGSLARAMAIMARWRWPPLSWCGKLPARARARECRFLLAIQ